MRVYLRDQKDNLSDYLEFYKSQQVAEYDKSKLLNNSSLIELNLDWNNRTVAKHILFDYLIFPANILTGFGQWKCEGRYMHVGDTIVQQAYLPPRLNFSQKLVFGVRVNNVWDTEDEFGFSYETLKGHPELGESKFFIRRSPDGTSAIFTISTISTAGTWLSRLVSPFFTKPYQAFCTRQALYNLSNQFSFS